MIILLKLVEEDLIAKVYKGWGYKVVVRRIDVGLPISIIVLPDGINKLFYPNFFVADGKLLINYTSMASIVMEKGSTFDWVDDVLGFIDEFYERYDEIITFKEIEQGL